MFATIILVFISRTQDEAQPQEQAGFGQGFGCMDSMRTVSKIIEISREYSEGFDSVETNAVLPALVDHDVGASHVSILAN
ncbi:hypothetical protein RB195_010633 [Necator americanus]|uniref:Uncharacterized protein n=1 Tax=Necator americanus TaxID=51031 RepID=A0ABR1CYX0_NECAM